MARIILGKKIENREFNTIKEITDKFEKVAIDIGTGDGKFIMEKAKKNPDTFWIGIDPNQNALVENSNKVVREKIPNVMFIISSIEQLESEFKNFADIIFINFPWRGLLKFLMDPDEEIIRKIGSIGKPHAEFEILFNHSSKYESFEMEKLGIVDLTEDYIKNHLIPLYKKNNLDTKSYNLLTNQDVQKMSIFWGKRLSFGRERNIWHLKGKILESDVTSPSYKTLNFK